MPSSLSPDQVIANLDALRKVLHKSETPDTAQTLLEAIQLIRAGEGWRLHVESLQKHVANLQAALNLAVDLEKKQKEIRKVTGRKARGKK
jgi:hypothetical protein